MSTHPRPGRPAVTWRSLGVVVAVLLVVALAILVGGRLAGTADQTPSADPTRSSGRPASATARDSQTGLRWADLDTLPSQVATTVGLIQRGGPFPYARDGVTFRNDQRLLPSRQAGYYREYTVKTPGESDRGARRVVTGDRGRQFFYTGDHYVSFVRIRV